MRKNCNLNLQLFPSLDSSSSPSTNVRGQSVTGASNGNSTSMFSNTRVFVCDATEIQAIAILLLARRDMENQFCFSRSRLKSPSLQFLLHGARGLSLKKSLRRFLEKRKERIQSTMPDKYL